MAHLKKYGVSLTLGPRYTMDCQIRDHVVRVDQPKGALGDDLGPTPIDYYLVSLGGCFGAIGRLIANQRRLPLRGMEIRVEGDLDVEVILGKSEEARAGFTELRVRVKIDADMSLEEKRAFLEEIEARCPVSDNTSNPTQLHSELVE